VPTATLTNSAEPSFGAFGLAETFSNDGTTATVSGWYGAYVYKATSESAWATSATPQATFTSKALEELLSAASSSDGTTVLLGGVESNAADVFELPATPAKLAFTAEPPSKIKAGARFSVKVAVDGSSGNVVTTDDTNRVTLALTSPAGAPGGALRCTKDHVIVSKGVANFTCRIDKAASGYELSAKSGKLVPAASSPFAVSPGKAAKLAFSREPPLKAHEGARFSVTVEVKDTFGNLLNADSINKVSLSLHEHGGSTAAELACKRNPTRVSKGLATFSCSVNTAGSDFNLSAESGKLAPATSSAFKVTTS
jgi:hypothetical protein